MILTLESYPLHILEYQRTIFTYTDAFNKNVVTRNLAIRGDQINLEMDAHVSQKLDTGAVYSNNVRGILENVV